MKKLTKKDKKNISTIINYNSIMSAREFNNVIVLGSYDETIPDFYNTSFGGICFHIANFALNIQTFEHIKNNGTNILFQVIKDTKEILCKSNIEPKFYETVNKMMNDITKQGVKSDTLMKLHCFLLDQEVYFDNINDYEEAVGKFNENPFVVMEKLTHDNSLDELYEL